LDWFRSEWGDKGEDKEGGDGDEEEKELEHKANFGLSGALAKDTETGNMFRGIVLKFSEPIDARNPNKRWRLYCFKNNELKQTLHIHRQSAYLVGREKKIADVLVEHPSCSKQHAVIQFRQKEKEDAMGKIHREVK
jgi:smad nuclear-interacting protein 1